MKQKPKPAKKAEKRRIIGGIVAGVLKKKAERHFMAQIDKIASASFRGHPFRYSMNKKVPVETVRPVARFLVSHYMKEEGFSRLHQEQLRKLLDIAENQKRLPSRKGRVPREIMEKLDAIGFKGDLDKLYVLFQGVMVRAKNERAGYTGYLFSKSKHPPYADEKVHVVDRASNYISNAFSKALDALWAYKAMKKR